MSTTFPLTKPARLLLTSSLRAETRDMLTIAWDQWTSPSDSGCERAARVLHAGLVRARRAGLSDSDLWAFLVELRPKTPSLQFREMLAFVTEWGMNRTEAAR